MRFQKPAFVLAFAVTTLLGSSALAHHRYEITGAFGGALGSRLGVGETGSRGDVGSGINPLYLVQLGIRTELDGFAVLSLTHQDLTLGYRASGTEKDTASLALTRQDLGLGGYLEHTYGKWVPYLGAQFGVTRFAASGFEDEYRPLLLVDGGVKYDLSEIVQLRFLARAPMTVVTAESRILCVSPASCNEPFNGTPYFQLQAGLGATFTF